MGERKSYSPGTFCWVDLATSDVEGATAFYHRVLGWMPQDIPATVGVAYRTMHRDGHLVAAVSQMPESQRASGAPPAWLAYVAVEDAALTAQRTEGLGGTVTAGPFEVADAGRAVMLRDPEGATLALWEARAHTGAALVNDPGALVLNQLNTPDPGAAEDFYTRLFGWTVFQAAIEPVPYWGIRNGDALNGGMMRLDEEGTGAHWLAYFSAEDLDLAAWTIGDAGGSVSVPATRIESGRILVATDPQGATFGLFEGPVDP